MTARVPVMAVPAAAVLILIRYGAVESAVSSGATAAVSAVVRPAVVRVATVHETIVPRAAQGVAPGAAFTCQAVVMHGCSRRSW